MNTEKMEALKNEVAGCEKCGLAATRNNIVFGVGNPHSPLLFVGEAPGENEDLQGEPFVGRGGMLLDKMLAAIDLSRNKNIYIANMVKCRPPQNRDPKPEEVSMCTPYLRAQTAILRPKIIVCLGRIAAQYIIDSKFKVTKEHGIFTERSGVLLMGTFHPAALLRNPLQKPDGMEDFIKLGEKIREVCPQVYSM